MTATTTGPLTARITAIVADGLGVPPAELTADTDLRAVQGADSIKVLRTVATIEREYDIELEDDDVFTFATVRDVVAAVAAALDRTGA